MARTKTRVRQHIMEEESIRIVRNTFPAHWVVRDYKPDYGIDLTAEIFEMIDPDKGKACTLGETVFLQVKSTDKVTIAPVGVRGRTNVELPRRATSAGPEDETQISVIKYELETSELLTVQAMGACIPVLLLLVELSTHRIYFLCLNDLVEKVILPDDPNYAAHKTRVIQIPTANVIAAGDPVSLGPVATYAKRPKLYAAFEKFAYQQHEIEYAISGYEMCATDDARNESGLRILGLTRHFLPIVLRYDFWTRMPEWAAIPASHAELRWLEVCLRDFAPITDIAAARHSFLARPFPSRLPPAFIESMNPEELQRELCVEIMFIWSRLGNLSRIYEELIREAFLPTELATYVPRPI
ncbi:MAG TPA: DUF4365 domain-containing protein [Terriglobia bacterium]|nr:DUF4365 domain-containing protein [Terriglobia bacterium]